MGFVAAFCTTNSFIVPNGPGLTFIELYRRFEGPINEGLYRDAVLRCEQGAVRLSAAGRVQNLVLATWSPTFLKNWNG
ncbi:MAG: hypothetical protein BGO01_07785 [Armatimonadetes bacterium 55-13]|nr:hypothetical protein [Armatimonadota bacterium]OJU63760.1 MAG: hypothetical protein BGO01_07785 [Armatimonadetes bacterium 55-13]